MHLVARVSASQMGQPCARDQEMRWVWVVQRGQQTVALDQDLVRDLRGARQSIDEVSQGAPLLDRR